MGFFDISRRLIEASQEADGVVAGDGGAEELDEERFDGGCAVGGEFCGVGFWACKGSYSACLTCTEMR